jgi:hypothetical protein
VPKGPTTARSESSSSVVKLLARSSGPSVSTPSVSVVETSNIVLSVSRRATLPGDQNPPLVRQELLASYVLSASNNQSSAIFDYSFVGLQCFQQRIGPNEHPCQERHYPSRCYPLPPVVRIPCKPTAKDILPLSLIYIPPQYAQPVTKKGKATAPADAAAAPVKTSNHAQRRLDERKKGMLSSLLLRFEFLYHI